MKLKKFVRPLAITAILMTLPLFGSLFLDGWAWSKFDYVFAGVMFLALASLFELGIYLSKHTMYRAGFGLALLTGFVIIWGNLAVGFIGSEENPINLLYFAILAVAFLASILVRFDAGKMSHIMYSTGLGIALVPVTAMITGTSINEHSVFVFNLLFAVLFVGSGLLFRNSTKGMK